MKFSWFSYWDPISTSPQPVFCYQTSHFEIILWIENDDKSKCRNNIRGLQRGCKALDDRYWSNYYYSHLLPKIAFDAEPQKKLDQTGVTERRKKSIDMRKRDSPRHIEILRDITELSFIYGKFLNNHIEPFKVWRLEEIAKRISKGSSRRRAASLNFKPFHAMWTKDIHRNSPIHQHPSRLTWRGPSGEETHVKSLSALVWLVRRMMPSIARLLLRSASWECTPCEVEKNAIWLLYAGGNVTDETWNKEEVRAELQMGFRKW